MVAKTLKKFYVEYRKGHNPITGEQNLYTSITDELIWNAATKAAEEKFKSPNKANLPLDAELAHCADCDNGECSGVLCNKSN